MNVDGYRQTMMNGEELEKVFITGVACWKMRKQAKWGNLFHKSIWAENFIILKKERSENRSSIH